jgi:hypothetical protein
MTKGSRPRRLVHLAACAALTVSTLALGGCSTNVGVGMSVGVPVGNHGYMSIGSRRWF